MAVPKKWFNSQLFIPGAWPFIIIVLSMSYSSEAQALSDEIIKQRIEAKASGTPELKGTRVRVDVEDGLVVLSGTVCLYAQKMTYKKNRMANHGRSGGGERNPRSPYVSLER